MTEHLTPDICVIGAGAAGLTVAAAAAAFGVEVVLIERERMGGDCLNTGCVPSKALIAAARAAADLRKARTFGIRAAEAEIDFDTVRSHVAAAIATIAPNDSEARFTGLGVRVIRAEARFTGPDEVVAGDKVIAARRFVVASGSTAAVPPIPGLGDVDYLTNETVFGLTARPRHLVVIGAGAIGLELGQAFRRLGAEVTVLEAKRPLHHEDPELADLVVERLVAEGVAIRSGVTIDRIDTLDGRIRVHLDAHGPDAEPVEGSHLLVATGRRPTVHALGLAAAGVDFSDDGITVDKGLRTSNRRVYAIGDVVAGAPKLTHVGGHHAGQVVRSILFRLPVNAGAAAIPRATFTDPEIAAVGLGEAEAFAGGAGARVLRWPYAENDRAVTEGETFGLIKLIVSRRGRVLGAAIVGHGAAEMIGFWALAVQRKAKLSSLSGLVLPYPTYTEIGKRAALTYFRTSLTNPWLRRIIGWLARLG